MSRASTSPPESLTPASQFLETFGPKLIQNRPGCTIGNPAGLPQPLDRDAFVDRWAPAMESDFAVVGVPEAEWVIGGMFYLPEGLVKALVGKARVECRDRVGAEWVWEDYKAVVERCLLDHDALEQQFRSTYSRRLKRRRFGCTTGKPQGLPKLSQDTFITTWVPEMENDFAALSIPDNDWAYAGMLYLPEGMLQNAVKHARNAIREETEAEWTWEDFKAAVLESIEDRAHMLSLGKTCAIGLLVCSLIVGGLASIGTAGAGAAATATAAAAAAAQPTVIYTNVAATGGFMSVLPSKLALAAIGAIAWFGGALGVVMSNGVRFLAHRK